MREEKFTCPDVDCGYYNFDGGECPQCGLSLDKIKGDDYMLAKDDIENEETEEPEITDFSDDPDDISWYSDNESYGTM